MRLYRVWMKCEQEITAENEEEARNIFWDEFHFWLGADYDPTNVEEIKD